MRIQHGWFDGTDRIHTISIFDDDGREIAIDVGDIANLIKSLQKAASEYLKSGVQLALQSLPRGDKEEKTAPKDDVAWTREFAPGFIGGKEIAQEASDVEVQMLIDLGNEIARLDRLLLESKEMRDNIVQGIKKKR